MKLSRKQLNLIIENFLKEEDWLSDEEEDLGPTKSQKINSALKSAIEQIKAELIASDYQTQGLSKDLVDYVAVLLDNIQLFINKKTHDEIAGVKAMAYHVDFGYEENKSVLHPDTIPGWLDIPVEIKEKFNEDKARYPVIVINDANVSEAEIKDILLHEVDHIKNGMIKAISKTTKIGPEEKLNLDIVKSLLRKDLIGKSKEDIVSKLESEGFINKKINYQALLDRLIMYYEGAHATPPDVLGVEEMSVRVSSLKRYPDALSDFKAGKRDYQYFKKTYTSDIADLVMFLDKNASLSTVNKIVKAETPQKNVTV